jgi:hypothetical protein
MGSVSAPVRDRSGAQRLDWPGKVHLSDNRLARPGRRRVTRHPDQLYLRGDYSGLRGPLWGPTLRGRISQSAEGLETEQGNPCETTAIEQLAYRAYPTLPKEHIKTGGRLCIRGRGRRHRHQNEVILVAANILHPLPLLPP